VSLGEENGQRAKGAPDHGATAVARLEDLERIGALYPTDDPHVKEHVARLSGQRTRWAMSLNGYWYRCS
jgi:hypothetical protein